MTTQTKLPDDYLRADDQYSMPTIIGMWVEDFESYTLYMTREEFDSTIADTKWLLELLRKARKERQRKQTGAIRRQARQHDDYPNPYESRDLCRIDGRSRTQQALT